MPQGVILNKELSRQRGVCVKRNWRGPVEFFIRHLPDGIGSRFAVPAQQSEGV